MPLKLNKNLKKYYSIGEVAAQFDVAESLLRFWEKEFPALVPHKDRTGKRVYTDEDIERVRTVYSLVKVRGLKLSAARKVLSTNGQKATDTANMLNLLQDIRAQLVEVRDALSE